MRLESLKKYLISCLITVLFLSNTTVSALSEYVQGAIQIDGYFDDWEPIPKTDFYYNDTMRHKVGLFRDDQYLYVYVHMTENGYARFNGANYNIFADGYQISYIVTTDVTPKAGQITPVTVRYQNGYTPVSASSGYVFMPSGSGSDQCEIAIPLSAFAYNGIWQPTGINTDNISSFTLTAPNLGSQTAAASGTDTLPVVGIFLIFTAAMGGIALAYKKRKNVK